MKKTLLWVCFLGVLLIGAFVSYRHLTSPLSSQEKEYFRKMKQVTNLYESAQKNIRKNKFKEAIENYREILTRVPNDLDAKVSLANTLAWDKQYDEAQKLIQEVLHEKSDHVDAGIVLGNIHAWQGNFQKSIELFQSLIKANPENENIWMALAHVYRWKGDKEKVIKTFQEVLKINSQHSEALKLLEQEQPK